MGNEDSYTKEFFDELFQKLGLSHSFTTRPHLEKYIILAAQKYMSLSNEYDSNLASHEVQRELKSALGHIDKAAHILVKVYRSGHYNSEIVNNLYEVINKKYPTLHGLLGVIKRGDGKMVSTTSPLPSLNLLGSMADAIEQTTKNFPTKKTSPKSTALYKWLMIVAAQLEKTLGRKLEQSRYYKGEYISKKGMNDSELLQFIMSPLDPNVTISQLETAIKDTRKERTNAPWASYFAL